MTPAQLQALTRRLLTLRLARMRLTYLTDHRVAHNDTRLASSAPHRALHGDLSGALRGALGWELKERGCLKGCDEEAAARGEEPQKRCGQEGCPYARAFLGEQWPRAGAHLEASTYQVVGPVLTAPLRREEPLCYEVRLFGGAVELAPLWLRAARGGARRGLGRDRARFSFEGAVDLWTGAPLWSWPDEPHAPSAQPLSQVLPPPPAPAGARRVALEVSTVSPLDLRDAPPPPAPPPLSLLLHAAVRRLYALNARFSPEGTEGLPPAPPAKWRFEELLGEQEGAEGAGEGAGESAPYERRRYNSTQRRRQPVRGVTGRWRYSVDEELLPCAWALLQAGGLVGLGQRCNVGMGRVAVRALGGALGEALGGEEGAAREG